MAINNHHHGNHYCTFPKAQTGAVLLAITLLIVIASSYYLARKLNTNLAKTQHSQETGIALNAARNALIGYAISYPDKVNANEGPGYLPCPDRNNDGSTDPGSCSLNGTTSIGRFPYKTLEGEELRDGHGERLWYVVSDNFRNNPKMTPLNSETAGNSSGDMTVDGYTNIAAVIFSAAAPENNQNRISANENDYTHYIEATFTDSDSDAVIDTITTAGTDRYILLTKDELMQAVEKRVLGEVKQTLLNYQTSYSAFPWLSPFSDPSTSIFRGASGTFQGTLPYHWSNDPDSIVVGTGNNIAGRNPFQTSVGWIWHTDVGTATEIFSGTITVDCLRNVDCSDGVFPPIIQVTTPSIDCTWSDKDTVNCPSAGTVTMSTISCDYGCGNFTCTREYQIDIPEYTGITSITNPADTNTRKRDVTLNGSLPIQSAAIRIQDTYIGDNPSTLCVGTTVRSIGTGVINFTASTTGTLQSTGIQYDLDIDNGELSSWFFSNEWNHLIYIAYPTVETLPGGATLCTAGTDCLALNNSGIPSSDKRALAIIAGEDLSPVVSPRPNGNLTDYLENENSSPVDRIFEKGQAAVNFNDQIKVISISP